MNRKETCQRRGRSGHRGPVRNLVFLTNTMMILLKERRWQYWLGSVPEMEQSLEHIFKMKLTEPSGG